MAPCNAAPRWLPWEVSLEVVGRGEGMGWQYESSERLAGKESTTKRETWVQFLGREDPLVPGEENGNPLQYSCLESPMDRGPWWATVRGVTKESDANRQ